MQADVALPRQARVWPVRLGSLVASPAFAVIGGMLAFALYLGIGFFVLTPQTVWSPDEGAKLLQLFSLRLEDSRLAYDIPYWGRDLDPELRYARFGEVSGLLKVRDGQLFFQRLPTFLLLGQPLFRWLGFHGLYLLPALAGAFCSILALLLLDRKDRRPTMWALIVFGSPIFVYSTIFWEHTPAVALGLAGAFLALRIDPAISAITRRRLLAWTAVGALLAASAYIRLEMVIFAVATLLAVFLVRQRNWGPCLAAAAFGLLLLPYTRLLVAMFGQPMPANAAYLFYPLSYLERVSWGAIPDLLVGLEGERAASARGLAELWAIAAIVALTHSFGPPPSRGAGLIRLLGLGASAVVGATLLFDSAFYRSAHGLLFAAPWALIGLCRAKEVWQQGDGRARVIVLSTVLGLLGYTVNVIFLRPTGAEGGLEWGARFAMVFYPPLALMAGWGLELNRRNAGTILLVGLLAVLGVGFQVRGLWTIRHDKQINAAVNQAIAGAPEWHVISDLWWLPFNAAPILGSRGVFVADRPDLLDSWARSVEERKIRGFTIVTLSGQMPAEIGRRLRGRSLNVVEAQRIENILVFRVSIDALPESMTGPPVPPAIGSAR